MILHGMLAFMIDIYGGCDRLRCLLMPYGCCVSLLFIIQTFRLFPPFMNVRLICNYQETREYRVIYDAISLLSVKHGLPPDNIPPTVNRHDAANLSRFGRELIRTTARARNAYTRVRW